MLLSGSMDGLLNVADLSGGLDEDDSFKACASATLLSRASHRSMPRGLGRRDVQELAGHRAPAPWGVQVPRAQEMAGNNRAVHDAMQAALNLDASVARMGLYEDASEALWVLSHTEGLHLWEWQAACDEEAAGAPG